MRPKLASTHSSGLTAALCAGAFLLAATDSPRAASDLLHGDRVAATDMSSQSRPQPKDGPLDRFGDWIDRSATHMREQMDHTFSAIGQAGAQTHEHLRNATTGVGKTMGGLAHLHMQVISERRRCPLATNGAPDCRTVAVAICRRHGFPAGRTFQTQSGQKCSAAAFLGRNGFDSNACRNETYVLSAMCESE